MPDQLTDRASKAAEEIVKIERENCKGVNPCFECCEDGDENAHCVTAPKEYAAIIERHWREWLSEKNRDAEKSRQFNESEIRRFEQNHKETEPCPEK